jgi:hypothetical protein
MIISQNNHLLLTARTTIFLKEGAVAIVVQMTATVNRVVSIPAANVASMTTLKRTVSVTNPNKKTISQNHRHQLRRITTFLTGAVATIVACMIVTVGMVVSIIAANVASFAGTEMYHRCYQPEEYDENHNNLRKRL